MFISRFEYKNNIWNLIAILLFSIVFATVLSSSSFLFDYYYPIDGTIFQIIGKGWSEGKLPYVDLWDQKGPYIYFVNAVGYWLTGNKYGLFIVQIVFLCASFTLLLHFWGKVFTKRVSFLLIIVLACHLAQLAPGLNVIELYELPFHILSFYLLWDWASKAKNQCQSHPAENALLYGVLLGICFLNRLTDAIGVCIGSFCVFIYLVNKKLWRNMWYNIGTFFVGFIAIVLPVFFYFYMNEALEEMLFASILFNFEYVNNTFREPPTIYAIISTCLAYISSLGLFTISLILVFVDKKNVSFHLMWAFIAFVTFFYFINTFMYEHYAIIAIPYFVLMTFEFESLVKLLPKRSVAFYFAKVGGFSVAGILLLNGIYQSYQSLKYCEKDETEVTQYYDPSVMDFLDEQKNELLCYNIHPSIYLYNDITPCCRFFSLQGWYACFSKTASSKIKESIEESNAKYILMRNANNDTLIDEILKDKYEIYPMKGLSQQFVLYLKQN